MQHLKWLSHIILPNKLLEFRILNWLLPIGASLLSGGMASKAAGKAADATAEAARISADTQLKMFEQSREDQRPWRESGATALDALMSMVGLPGRGGTSTAPKSNKYQWGENTLTQPEQQQLSQNYLQRGSSYSARVPEPNDMQWRHRAQGGPVGAGEYIVGEDGPEKLTMYGDGTGYVTPNPRTVANSMGYLPGRATGGAVGAMWGKYGTNMVGPNAATSGYQSSGSGMDGGQLPGYYPGQGADMAQSGQAINYAAGPTPENPGGQPGRYNFMAEPGYNFRRQEGVRAVDMSAASRGQLLSGGHLKALTRYGQDYASNEYANVYNRIANIAGLGQTATAQTGALGANAAQGIANSQMNQGMARASGYLGQSNAWGNALTQGIQLYGAMNPAGGSLVPGYSAGTTPAMKTFGGWG